MEKVNEQPAMSEKMMDAERAAFEEWYAGYACVTAERVKTWRSGDGYREEYAGACSAWEVWQARASLPVGVPDGYALVPVEPTDEMRDAGNVYTLNRSTLFRSWHAMLAAAPTVKAEQVQCDTCHGQGEICVGQQTFGYMSMQPPEPIMEVCPECGGEETPSLPAAGSAEWIEHGSSKACPFSSPYTSKVDVRLRDGTERLGDLACNTMWFWCEHDPKPYDVVAYRIAALSAQQPRQSAGGQDE